MRKYFLILILMALFSCKKENVSNDFNIKSKIVVLKSNIEKDGYLCDLCMVDNNLFYIAKNKINIKGSDGSQPSPTGTFIYEEYASPSGGCHIIIDCAGPPSNCYRGKDLSIVKVTCVD